jgi:hypothetical protein
MLLGFIGFLVGNDNRARFCMMYGVGILLRRRCFQIVPNSRRQRCFYALLLSFYGRWVGVIGPSQSVWNITKIN